MDALCVCAMRALDVCLVSCVLCTGCLSCVSVSMSHVCLSSSIYQLHALSESDELDARAHVRVSSPDARTTYVLYSLEHA